MYRKREAELLSALEGVIQRCKELEHAHYLHNHQQEQLPRSSLDFHDHDITTTSLLHKLSSEQSYQNVSRPGVHSSSSIPPSAGINRYNTSTAVGVGAMDGRGEVRGRQMQRGSAGSAGQRQHTSSNSAGREARSRSASHRAWH